MNKDIQFSRTKNLIGEEALGILAKSNVAVFGIGGVGSFACEALARAGVGRITIVDSDVVDITNLNRQLIALHSTVGLPKVEVMRDRIKDINKEAKVVCIQKFYLPENADEVDLTEFDYIVDAIDTVSAKLELIKRAKERGVPVISSMGTGNKLNPADFEVADISKTSVCPLAKVIRKELRNIGIEHLKVVYSKEQPARAIYEKDEETRKVAPASISFVPPVAGFIIASEVIKDLTSEAIATRTKE